MVNNKSIDFSDTGDAEFGEDSNGNAYLEHKSTGERVTLGSEGIDVPALNFTDDKDPKHHLKIEARDDIRPSFDAYDFFFSAPEYQAGGNPHNSDVIFENGMQLDVLMDPSVSTAQREYVSERLKFLPTGEFALETDVIDQNLTLSSEHGGGIKFETTDGGNGGKHKQDRLKINGTGKDLENAFWSAMNTVRFCEWPKNNSHAGRIHLGLNETEGNGAKLEYDGRKLILETPDDGDVIDLKYPDSTIGIRLFKKDVRLINTTHLDLKDAVIRGDGASSRVKIDDFLSLRPRKSAPSTPTAGDVAMQDGKNWDPAGKGDERLVVYQNNNWVSIS